MLSEYETIGFDMHELLMNKRTIFGLQVAMREAQLSSE